MTSPPVSTGDRCGATSAIATATRSSGLPLCADCYDYTAHVVWQWHAPELWRRTTIALQRDLARRCGLTVGQFKDRCSIAYSKVAEFQARGVIHLHVPIRLDGPGGPDGEPPDLPLATADLEAAVHATASRVRLLSAPLADGHVYRLRWGDQVDCRTITDTADRDTARHVPVVHPEQVGSYLAKYLTKATEASGSRPRCDRPAHARLAGATDHAVRIIDTAEQLAGAWRGLRDAPPHLGTLGYRGHPITKSRAYSVTFGQLRHARRCWRRQRGRLRHRRRRPRAHRRRRRHPRRIPADLLVGVRSARATSTSTRPPRPSGPPPVHRTRCVRARDKTSHDETRGKMMTKQSEPVPMPERLWTVQETSAFLSIPVGTLYQWHHRGEGPQPYKIGKHLRYDPRAVMRWLEESAA